MFQDVRGPRTGAKVFHLDAQTLTIQIPVRFRGKQVMETIDLKPHLQAHNQSTKTQPGT